MKRPSLSVQIVAGLAAGLGLGIAAAASGSPALLRIATGVEPAGTVWVNLIRMVVIPLVAGAVVTSVAGLGDVGRLGRLGARAIGFFLASGAAAIAIGLVLAALVLPLAPVSDAAAAGLRSAAAAGAADLGQSVRSLPGFAQFVVGLVPANPFKAAADGALLPVIVFALLFGAAAAHLDDRRRRLITDLADAVVAALVRMIGWAMLLAPFGVACLAAPVGARLGWETLASLGLFVALVAVGCLLFSALVLGPVVRALVRLPLGRFIRAVAPAWVVGFTTTSSMAALPAMIEAAQDDLGVSAPVAGFTVPLAATLNRPGSALYQAVAAVFVAQLYGVHLGPAQFAALAGTMLVLTFSVPAMPRSSVLSLAPALLSAGVPLDGLGLLVGVDQVPDMFRTATNVAGHVTAAAVLARGEGETLR